MKRQFFILFAVLILHSAFFIHRSAAGVIQLPQTGQTKCYDTAGAEINCAGTGLDGAIRAGAAWPNPRFVVNGNCVTDNLTGLMWSKDGYLFGYMTTWQGALERVNILNNSGGLCGYTDWRLPNLNEMKSRLNRQQINSAVWLNGQGFSNADNIYWSSSTYAYDTNYAWVVNYGYNFDVGYSLKAGGSATVWPVRSGQ